MPLSLTSIKNTIRPVLLSNLENSDPAQSREDFVNSFSDAIANAIKDGLEGAEITAVLTSPSGAVTGPITITLQIVP